MPLSTEQKTYYSFIEEYTYFLEHMLSDEHDKLSALQSRELPKIEHSIAVSQANAKQLANYELKRASLQAKAGFEGFSFRKIIAASPDDMQNQLWDLFTRFEHSVSDIRFHNDKSMAVARDNMLALDPTAVLPGAGNKKTAQSQNPYRQMQGRQEDQSNILETKI